MDQPEAIPHNSAVFLENPENGERIHATVRQIEGRTFAFTAEELYLFHRKQRVFICIMPYEPYRRLDAGAVTVINAGGPATIVGARRPR